MKAQERVEVNLHKLLH